MSRQTQPHHETRGQNRLQIKGRPRISITREEFEAPADLLQRTVELTLSALEASAMERMKSTLCFVGGSTRMPMVRKVIKDIFEETQG